MEREKLTIDLQDDFFLKNIEKIKSEKPKLLFKKHQIEQIGFRMYICSKCLENKKCVFCGCNPLDVIAEPYSCNHEKVYPNLLQEIEWEKFKKERNIEIK